MTTIAVVDHGAGNLVSIGNGLRRCGAEPRIVVDGDALSGCDGMVLPGVGSAAEAMRRLDEAGLSGAIRRWEGPLLGICVGFQVLFDHSAEGDTPGLGLLPGTVAPLRGRPLPHMGWNDVTPTTADPLLAGVAGGELFYFVHSYAPEPTAATTIAVADHGGERFAAAARSGPIAGVQFHPERSGPAGRRLLANFVAACAEAARAA